MDTLIERILTPETARNLSLLLAFIVLAWRPASALLQRSPATLVVYDFLVCGVGLLALLRFDAAMLRYATSAFPLEAVWLRVALPGISAAMYAATWSLLFGSVLPWVFQRAESMDGPQTWRERLAGGLLAAGATYLVAFFVAPLPSALEQALHASHAEQRSLQRQAESAFHGQRLVSADVVCAAARSLFLDARLKETSARSAFAGPAIADLDAWRTGLGLPAFGGRHFQAQCADAVVRRHPAQIRSFMRQWSDLSARLRKAGIDVALPQWPELSDAGPPDAGARAQGAIDLSGYVARTVTDPVAQVKYALARTDGATVFQLVMELVLVLMAWPATRIGSAPATLQPELPAARRDNASGSGGAA